MQSSKSTKIGVRFYTSYSHLISHKKDPRKKTKTCSFRVANDPTFPKKYFFCRKKSLDKLLYLVVYSFKHTQFHF